MGVECTCLIKSGDNPSCLVHGSEKVPSYVVLRSAPGLPDHILGKHEGKWFNDVDPMVTWNSQSNGTIVLRRTDRFERRDPDGATARVYEVGWSEAAMLVLRSIVDAD